MKRSANAILAAHRDWHDPGDPWGSVMMTSFALARTMMLRGDAPGDYRPGLGGHRIPDEDNGDPFEDVAIWEESQECSDDDLRYAWSVLERYRRLCVLAGRDY